MMDSALTEFLENRTFDVIAELRYRQYKRAGHSSEDAARLAGCDLGVTGRTVYRSRARVRNLVMDAPSVQIGLETVLNVPKDNVVTA